MLNSTLQKHLERFSTPVARDMKDNMYVDNILSGADTELNASQYYDESRSIMTEAKFNLQFAHGPQIVRHFNRKQLKMEQLTQLQKLISMFSAYDGTHPLIPFILQPRNPYLTATN